MYLSELSIVGFKSFARKTNLLFDSGITGIVGPNGCGKSNIVDAIRWVMGEQKSGALRSDRMESVIFNGSATAKPVGMAEVSLKIENTRNILPVDYSEVLITRRLFRSGESQYLINGNQCRLKDILDLFMDTGAGPHTYSVIELPQVERILNGKEDERRHIFEEAAGITKYKLRRKATFRKLESTEKDLIRIEDIMSEVEKTVRTLRRQVAKAQRYQELAEELKNLEIQLANHEYGKILGELEPLETQLDLVRDERESSSSTLAKQDSDYESTRTRLLEIERALSEKQRIVNEQSREIQKFEERVLVNRERVRSLQETSVRNSQEKVTFEDRLRDLQEQVERINIKTADAEKILLEKRQEFEERNNAFQLVRREYDEKRAIIRDAEAQVLRITEELSRKQNEGERLKATEENLVRRTEQLEIEALAEEQRFAELSKKLEETREAEKTEFKSLEDKKKRLLELGRFEDDAKRSFELLQKNESQDRNRIEVLGHQAELIKRLIDNFEDYPSGVRYLATQSIPGFQTFGPLANIIQVQNMYRVALSAALGETATYLVVDDQHAAFSGIGLLKEEKRGVVTFAPCSEFAAAQGKRQQVSDLGVVGWADELVKCEERFSSLVHHLLGHFLVVQDLQTAHRVTDEVKRERINVVTLSGEVLGHSGLIRGGISNKNQSDFVGRKEQLDALLLEIEKLNQGIENRRSQMAQRETEIQQNKIEFQGLGADIKKLEESLAGTRIALGQLTYEEQSLTAARIKRDTEKLYLLGEISQLGQNLELQAHGTDDLQSKRKQNAQKAGDLSNDVRTVEKDLNSASAVLQEISIQVARLQSDFEAHTRERESILRQVSEAQQMTHARTNEIAHAEKEMKELEQANGAYQSQVQSLKEKREALQVELDDLEEQQYQENTKVAEQEKTIRSARSKFDELSEGVHRIELRASELKLRSENLKARMLSEFEYVLQRMQTDASFSLEDNRSRVEDLREKLKEVGPVNLLALKEFEQEKERLDFLQTQRDDLIKARKNLTETIDIINTTARQKFLETFEQVHKNFAKVFSTFFEGGKASLVLQETADPLEAEIEILATPGGKRPTALTLLSGGEKSLTAISLLFAIYLVKPSPFCIFDEVDAPLDDQNVKRFTSALQEFTNNTQFMIVTHNKLTMRAADQLYGITMEEKGISKVVSVKFDTTKNGDLVAEPTAA